MANGLTVGDANKLADELNKIAFTLTKHIKADITSDIAKINAHISKLTDDLNDKIKGTIHSAFNELSNVIFPAPAAPIAPVAPTQPFIDAELLKYNDGVSNFIGVNVFKSSITNTDADVVKIIKDIDQKLEKLTYDNKKDTKDSFKIKYMDVINKYKDYVESLKTVLNNTQAGGGTKNNKSKKVKSKKSKKSKSKKSKKSKKQRDQNM